MTRPSKPPDEGGAIAGEGTIPAEESGLARLVLELGTEVEGCVEMMRGAVWVRDKLAAAGWKMKVAHARKVRDVAPLACKTDKVDARVLAELCRRDLVPELWVPSAADRALRERLRRRMHLVKTRTSARNRIFGLLTQFGLRISHTRLREPDAMELLAERGVPEVWQASIAELLELAAEMDRRIDPIGYAGLAPRVSQSGERSATAAAPLEGGALNGSRRLSMCQEAIKILRATADFAGFPKQLPGTICAS